MHMGKNKAPKLQTHFSPAGWAALGLRYSRLGEEGDTDPLDFAKASRLRSPAPPTGLLFALFVYSSATLAWGFGSNFLPALVRPQALS